jgi:hypothetical protein
VPNRCLTAFRGTSCRLPASQDGAPHVNISDFRKCYPLSMRSRRGGRLTLLVLAIATAAPAAGASPQASPSPSPPPQQSSASTATAQAEPRLINTVARQGPFSIGSQQYTVLLHNKVLLENPSRTAGSEDSTATLGSLEILDAQGNSVYQETFAYTLGLRDFTQTLSASSALLPGAGGVALVIRFLERSAPPSQDAEPQFAKESWQVFGIVNGHLAPFGGVLPLGRGTDITVGGVLAAVMMKGGIAVMPMASTAEVVALRVWNGNFYALVPVRFDWPHGRWGEGEQCYALDNGSLRERGCIMRMEAAPEPRPPDADTIYMHLFEAPDGNLDNSLNVPVSPDSHAEFLEMMAIVEWQTQSQRNECSFRNLWLRTRIDGKEGWVHGQEAFDALGLPLKKSPR